ncbi:MAG: hypothetical protein FWB74_01200 [Defluviitaleaceae bacterium]|nr:hypothetical protein [Defluviitaleaceae bacterium]
MRKYISNFVFFAIFVFMFTGCGGGGAEAAEPRAVYVLDRVYVDEVPVTATETGFDGSRLTFVGAEAGGNVIIRVGEHDVHATINPSRSHPSFAEGIWHHHLYAGAVGPGTPRVSFLNALPGLGIDHNPNAIDNTQSIYQHGNLHYIVQTGEFRLRFPIGGVFHDLFFIKN